MSDSVGGERPAGHSRISHYRIISRLGAGGMGEVYLAEDMRLGREVALKLLPAEFTSNQERVRRFEQEARAVSALNHPHIITVHEIGEAEAGRFIVMELVRGQTLRSLAKPCAPFLIAELGGQIAKALAVTHAAGITHRDIKPENLMLRDDGYVKVLDFGLARLMPTAAADSETATIAFNTAPGALLGTVAYMSPEQARGEPVTHASDIFALGIVLYELATGQHPFRSDSTVGYLHAITGQTPLPPSRLRLDLPAALDGLIARMLKKEAAQRPSAREVSELLDEVGGRRSSLFEPATKPMDDVRTVGRTKEREALRAAFAATVEGRGQLLCVTGEPGIGKTTLVEAFLEELVANGQCTIARGRCSERLAGTEAYLPLLEALENLLQGGVYPDAGRALQQIAPTWYAQIVPLSSEAGESARSQIEVQVVSQERLKREFAHFLQAVAHAQPLVLFIDDLHWADISTIDLLGFLAAKFSALNVLVVVTYRASDMLLANHPFLLIKPDLQARGVCRDVPLGFLSEAEIEEYLGREFPGHRFPGEFPQLILSKTEGNPLFMVDLVRYLRQRGVIADASGVWALEQALPEIERELPESVRAMIERKIGQLGESGRQLLTAASVQGYEFDSATVAKALNRTADEIEESLDALERSHAFVQFVREDEFPDHTLTLRYRFVHVLYQNVLSGSLRSTRRASLSAALGNALLAFYVNKPDKAASELATLYEMARDWRAAAECFLIAARNAARVFADAETAALAQRGLANVGRLPPSAERSRLELRLQTTLGAALMTSHTYASSAVKQAFLRAEELCRELVDNRQLFRVQFGLSIICAVRGEYAGARSLAEECSHLAERVGNEELLAQAHWANGLSLQYVGEYRACRTQLEQAVALGHSVQHASAISLQKKIAGVFSEGHLAVVLLYLGWPDQAETLKENVLARKEASAHPLSLADNLYQAAFVDVFHRRVADVRTLSAFIMDYAEEQGLKWYAAIGRMLRGWALVMTGSVEEGLAQLRDGLSSYRATETELSLTFYWALLADACDAAGFYEQASEALAEGLAVAERIGERYFEAELHRLNGNLLLTASEGDRSSWAAAERAFNRALRLSRQQGVKSFELRAVMDLARMWQRQGKRAAARQMLAEICSWFTEGFDTPDLREAKGLLIELTS